MKLPYYTQLFVFVPAVFFSCSTDIKVSQDLVERTNIIGILKSSVDTNYIRIEKTFLPVNESALNVSAEADRIFYEADEIETWLQNTLTGEILPLERVDGDTLGLVKEEGIFSYAPNILYRYIGPLNQGETYSIYVHVFDTNDTVSASAEIVSSLFPVIPAEGGAMDFLSDAVTHYKCIAPSNGFIYDLWLRFHYAEKNILTGDSTIHEIQWQIIANRVDDSSTIEYDISSKSFYFFLHNNIAEINFVKRYFLDMDFTWYAGGLSLLHGYENAVATNGILTGYITPVYTNVSNGIGIFSSLYVRPVENITLTAGSLDSLACGSITSGLNFLPDPSSINYPGCN